MENAKKSSPAEVKQSVADYFEDLNITMADAGIRMGMSRASVSYALSVRDKYFTNAQAAKYARCFQMDMDYLTKGVGELIDRDPRYTKDGYRGSRPSFEDMSPDMQKKTLSYESFRYRKALSDLASLSVILDILEKEKQTYEVDYQRLNDEEKDDSVFQEKILLNLHKRQEIQSAINYTMERIDSATGVANSIELERMRRENPELWKNVDKDEKEKGSESTARRFLDGYLGEADDSSIDDSGCVN